LTKVRPRVYSGSMALKRTAIHLDAADMKVLDRLAKQETAKTGSTVTASMLVRRLIREHVRQVRGEA
jgi:hypothetical protein